MNLSTVMLRPGDYGLSLLLLSFHVYAVIFVF
uniref:Uncharacterized protein n=1 Tax=Arundo donax TaxID=35708 RepID=A0A0A9ANV6_ARUDO